MHLQIKGAMENQRQQYDLGDLLVKYKDQFEARYSLMPGQDKVFKDIANCRTQALGGHQDRL